MAQHNLKKAALAVAFSFAAGGALAQTGVNSPSQVNKSGSASTASSQPPLTDAGGANSRSKGPATASGKSGALAHGDRKFVEDAAKDGLAEVELGKLASSKATNDQVKQFAQRMVTDHGKANDELKSLASAKDVDVPASTDRKHQKELDKMSKADASRFDREYMEHMVKEHKKDVKEFEKQAKHAKDPELKAFAEKTLPTLHDHLQLAQSTYDAVKHGGKTASNAGPGTSNPGAITGNTTGRMSSSNTATGGNASSNGTKSDR